MQVCNQYYSYFYPPTKFIYFQAQFQTPAHDLTLREDVKLDSKFAFFCFSSHQWTLHWMQIHGFSGSRFHFTVVWSGLPLRAAWVHPRLRCHGCPTVFKDAGAFPRMHSRCPQLRWTSRNIVFAARPSRQLRNWVHISSDSPQGI